MCLVLNITYIHMPTGPPLGPSANHPARLFAGTHATSRASAHSSHRALASSANSFLHLIRPSQRLRSVSRLVCSALRAPAAVYSVDARAQRGTADYTSVSVQVAKSG